MLGYLIPTPSFTLILRLHTYTYTYLTTMTSANLNNAQSLFDTLASALNDNYVCGDMNEAEALAEQLIDDLVIEDVEEIEALCESYAGCDDGWHPERDFTEEYCNEAGLADPNSPLYSCIDFQDVWDSLLRYDMFTVKTSVCTYFFHC